MKIDELIEALRELAEQGILTLKQCNALVNVGLKGKEILARKTSEILPMVQALTELPITHVEVTRNPGMSSIRDFFYTVTSGVLVLTTKSPGANIFLVKSGAVYHAQIRKKHLAVYRINLDQLIKISANVTQHTGFYKALKLDAEELIVEQIFLDQDNYIPEATIQFFNFVKTLTSG